MGTYENTSGEIWMSIACAFLAKWHLVWNFFTKKVSFTVIYAMYDAGVLVRPFLIFSTQGNILINGDGRAFVCGFGMSEFSNVCPFFWCTSMPYMRCIIYYRRLPI